MSVRDRITMQRYRFQGRLFPYFQIYILILAFQVIHVCRSLVGSVLAN